MGNKNSTAVDWDSDQDGGSDYEHAYKFHSPVLSPADGFESDCEDEEDAECCVGKQQTQPAFADKRSILSPAVRVAESGDLSHRINYHNESVHACSDSSDVPRVQQSAVVKTRSGQTAAQDKVAGTESRHQTSSAASAIPKSQPRSSQQLDRGEMYEEKEAEVNEDDDDSFSSITPPRARPQSESEFSASEESEVGDENAVEDDISTSSSLDYESVIENLPHCISVSPTQQSKDPQVHTSIRTSDNKSMLTVREQFPHQIGISLDSHHRSRKRPAILLNERKSEKAIKLSPLRNRYGIFDTDSESDTTLRKKKRSTTSETRNNNKTRSIQTAPPPSKTIQATGSLGAKSIQLAAKKAACEFMKTSRKILQEAKTAARILRVSADSLAVPVVARNLSEGNSQSLGLRKSRRTRDVSHEVDGVSGYASTSRKLRGVKRKAQSKEQTNITIADYTDTEMEDIAKGSHSGSWRHIRKDGGWRRKTSTVSSVSRLYPCVSPTPELPDASNRSPPLTAVCKAPVLMVTKDSLTSASSNPFQNVSLIAASTLNSCTGSAESSSQQSLTVSKGSSLNTLLTESQREMMPLVPAALSSGSIWARINMHANQQFSDPGCPETRNHSPQTSECVRIMKQTTSISSQPLSIIDESAAFSGHKTPIASERISPAKHHHAESRSADPERMKTRNCPATVVSTTYPDHSPSRLPLTGQFAQSGCFSFLLEDVLHITVTTSNITMATTSAIVVCTDCQLEHKNKLANSIAMAAGREFALACQDYLKQNAAGLKVCEVLDTPAGGQLSLLISHVLHVVAPDWDGDKNKRLLLCTYLNCLKHASEKLQLSSITFPLIGTENHSVDECIEVFFDCLLVYLAERTSTCPLHTVHLHVSGPAVGHFAAEVLGTRLKTLVRTSVSAAVAAVFREYFNIPDFNYIETSPSTAADRSPSGRPAVKRRRL